MQFLKTNKTGLTKAVYMAILRRAGLRFLSSRKLNAADTAISNCLTKKYGFGLKIACIRLLNKLNVDISNPEEVIVYWQDDYWNKLVRLITYGDGKLVGSTILRDMFSIRI